MTLDQVLRNRRSVRLYREEPVPEEAIRQIVEAGMWAPSACNKQAGRFLYLDRPECFEAILKNGAASFLSSVKQGILVLYDDRIDNVEYRDNLLSAAASIENMLLKACDLGVSACWVCNLPSKRKLRKLFNIPRWYEPIALVTLGYGRQEARDVPRKHTVEQILHHNVFDAEMDEKTERQPGGAGVSVKRFLRRIYLRMPKTAWVRGMADKLEKKFEN